MVVLDLLGVFRLRYFVQKWVISVVRWHHEAPLAIYEHPRVYPTPQ